MAQARQCMEQNTRPVIPSLSTLILQEKWAPPPQYVAIVLKSSVDYKAKIHILAKKFEIDWAHPSALEGFDFDFDRESGSDEFRQRTPMPVMGLEILLVDFGSLGWIERRKAIENLGLRAAHPIEMLVTLLVYPDFPFCVLAPGLESTCISYRDCTDPPSVMAKLVKGLDTPGPEGTNLCLFTDTIDERNRRCLGMWPVTMPWPGPHRFACVRK